MEAGDDAASHAQSSQEVVLRRVEQSDAIVEILWIMHSSPVFLKAIKKAGVTPTERLHAFASAV